MYQITRNITKLMLFGSAVLACSLPATAQEGAHVSQQLAQARAATARYHDISNAVQDGFTPLGSGVCHNGEDGNAVGISYINLPRFLSADIDIEEPEVFNYFPIGDGNVRLVGVAYLNRSLFRDTRPPSTPGYRPGNFVWTQPDIPDYLEVVSGPFSLFDQESRPTFSGRWLHIITVWLWADNPNGIFADGNPGLTCPGT